MPTFRNYRFWKPYLEVGNILDGLILRGTDTIDADSHPIFIKKSELKEDELSTPKIELQRTLF